MPARTAVVRPLFHEALSGEFQPASDELKRAHTLGRLATASYKKGNTTEDSYEGLRVVQYVPSWAPDATVKTYWHETGWADVLTRLKIVAPRRDPLIIVDQIGEDVIEVMGGNPGNYYHGALALGDDLKVAQDAVTKAANGFFNGTQA